MVIVATIALSTMVSNQIVMPLAMRWFEGGRAYSGDVRDLMLISRRVSIGVIFALGFLYFQLTGGSEALAAIGLIAFAGIAQVLPALLAGLFWRGATRAGAMAGMAAGAVLWGYTLFLPSFDGRFLLSRAVLDEGLLGLAALRPQALFGFDPGDPLIHALVWSLGLNTALLVLVSLATRPSALERIQASLFVDVFRGSTSAESAAIRRTAASEDLFVLAQRILGVEAARRLFAEMAIEQGITHGLPRPTEAMISRLERELSGSIGAASAHAMVSSAAGSEQISLSELMEMADETQRLMATSQRLADKTAELERTAAELREVNTRLRALDAQKDDFLSQVSHELRTPMTSIRSFSEILLSEDLDGEQITRFVRIIHDESLRLTRLLDEILDINRLESGSAEMPVEPVAAEEALTAAIDTLRPIARDAGAEIMPHEPVEGMVRANPDRLRQVLINLVSNAIKYNDAAEPRVEFAWHVEGHALCIDVIDNGGGVSREEADRIFSKFVRGSRSAAAQGAGLGLPISRAAIRRMGGDLGVVFTPEQTSFFRLRLPRVVQPAAERALDETGSGASEEDGSAAAAGAASPA